MLTNRRLLSLFVTAIVVIVIIFVVLGLGLGLTKTIFKEGKDLKYPKRIYAIPTRDEFEPTPEIPIAIPQAVEISPMDAKTISIGFYNRGENTAVQATFSIQSCLREDKSSVEAEFLPSITSNSQNVAPNSANSYNIVLTERGLPKGIYLCMITVACAPGSSECDASAVPYETKQFFLRVIP